METIRETTARALPIARATQELALLSALPHSSTTLTFSRIYTVTLTIKDTRTPLNLLSPYQSADNVTIRLFPKFVAVMGNAWIVLSQSGSVTNTATPTQITFSNTTTFAPTGYKFPTLTYTATIEGPANSIVGGGVQYFVVLPNSLDYQITMSYSGGTHTCIYPVHISSLATVYVSNIFC